MHGARKLAHSGQVFGLVDRKRIGARKLDQKQVILDQVMLEGRFGQCAGTKLFDEVMADIAFPGVGCARTQFAKQAVARNDIGKGGGLAHGCFVPFCGIGHHGSDGGHSNKNRPARAKQAGLIFRGQGAGRKAHVSTLSKSVFAFVDPGHLDGFENLFV